MATWLRPPASIRNRLVAMFAAGAGILLVLSCALLYIGFDAQLDGTIDQTLRDRAAEMTVDLQQGNLQIRAGEPFALLLDRDTGRVIDSTSDTAGTAVLSRRELAQAREREVVVDRRRVTGLGDRGRLLARPETTPQGANVIIVVGESLDTVAHARQRLGLLLGITSPFLIAAIAGCGWVLAGAALRPVERMTEEAEAISSLHEGGKRLAQPPGDDEIAHLGRTLNAMLDRIEAAVARERAFVDDASHELRTPLSILRGELELACDRPGSRTEMRRSLQSALYEAEQLGRLTEDLLTLARADSGRLEPRLQPVDLLAAVRRAADRHRTTPGPEIDVVGPPVTVCADPVLLDRMLINLIANASRHATARVQVGVSADGEGGEFVVADDGGGFPEPFLAVAFDRFTRADADRGRDHGGTGLGLAIVAAVVQAQHGRVEVGNGGPLGGARVQVWLPLADASVEPPAGATVA